MQVIALACALLLACGPAVEPQAPAPPAPPCKTAAEHLVDLVVAPQDPKPPDEAVNQLIASTAQACEKDAWSPAARTCFSKVKTVEDADACSKELTAAQLEALAKSVPKSRE